MSVDGSSIPCEECGEGVVALYADATVRMEPVGEHTRPTGVALFLDSYQHPPYSRCDECDAQWDHKHPITMRLVNMVHEERFDVVPSAVRSSWA